MFGKLLKHEFKGTVRLFLMIYIFVGIIGGMAYLLSKTNIGVATGLLTFVYIVVGIALPFITFLILAIRFNKTMYGTEGYLTNTLPVTNKQLYFSKFLVSYVWSVISSAIAIAVFYSFLKVSGVWDQFILGFMEGFGIEPPIGFFILMGLNLLLSLFAFYVQMYFACTISSTSWLQGLGAGGPILIYFGLFIGMNILSTITTLFIPVTVHFSKTYKFQRIAFELPYKLSELVSESYQPDGFVMGLGGTIFNIVIYALIIFFTLKLMKKKVCVK